MKEVTPEETQRHPVLVNRVNMVLKNSDIVRASMLLGRELNNDADVKTADALFAERGEKKVKLRPVVDMRESGLDASFPRSPYQSHGLCVHLQWPALPVPVCAFWDDHGPTVLPCV